MSLILKPARFENASGVLRIFLTLIRMLIGWHFMYEGLAKALMPNWSAAGYLMSSHWLFSGFFHRIAENPLLLQIVNLLNIYGLVLIGLLLITGFLTRPASLAGALLLILYYIANPPLAGFIGETTGEGHYLLVNKNLIELALLMLFFVLPGAFSFGVDRLLTRFKKPVSSELVLQDQSKRETLKDLASLPVLGVLSIALFKKQRWESWEEQHLVSNPSRTDAVTGASPRGANFASLKDLKTKVPCGKIGSLEISRLICGGNLISGYAHSRDLLYVSPLVENYFTDEKVMETLSLCEACGINTAFIRVDSNTLRVIKKYRHRGGKIQWFAQCKITNVDITSDIDAAVDHGAVGAYLHGGICDEMVAKGQIEFLWRALEHIKKRGVLAGIGAHKLQVPMAVEKAGLNPDFYMKTLNSGNYWTAGPKVPKPDNWVPDPQRIVEPELLDPGQDNIWSLTPRQTIEFMKGVTKPWVAYKVLGAGAIKPEEGLRYVFENGADFACVGMFDFQVVQDANITVDLMSKQMNRSRVWMA
jgi:uncharacterized membrane protein YphA (DoxX/SURF4 family)